jgi:thioredoxin 1
MRKFTAEETQYLIESSAIAIVHLDAAWDGYRLTIARKINEILADPPADVAFAYVDVDEQVELARSLKVINVPTVAYFRHGKLVGSVIGQGQDISRNIERIRTGEQLDSSNTVSAY